MIYYNQFLTQQIHLFKHTHKHPSKQSVYLDVSATKYPVLRAVAQHLFGWQLLEQFSPIADIIWSDQPIYCEDLSALSQKQKINHFPGMQTLGRKNLLSRCLSKFKKSFPEKYDFLPETWLLPYNAKEFMKDFDKRKKTYIVKPEASCQGKGIFLCKSLQNLDLTTHCVVQEYIQQPLLIDKLKFDLRVYVLVTGCEPLRILLGREGLARFSTQQYQKPIKQNIENTYMHLTNYAINKHNSKFSADLKDSKSHKRSFHSAFESMRALGVDTDMLWQQIQQIVVKTIIAVQPQLRQNYLAAKPDNLVNDMCFQLLGFDIIVDKKGKPFLLEVNQMPSLSTDSAIDSEVKVKLVYNTLKLVGTSEQEKRRKNMRSKMQARKRVMTGKKMKLNSEQKSQMLARVQSERQVLQNKNEFFQKIFPSENSCLQEQYSGYIQFCKRHDQLKAGLHIVRNQKRANTKQPQPENVLPKLNTREMLEKIYRLKRPLVKFEKRGVSRQTTRGQKRTEKTKSDF